MTATPPEKRTNLSAAEKKAFLEQRLRRKLQDGSTESLIPHRTQTTPPPLSYGQEGIWYAEQLHPQTATYNMPFAWRLRGPLAVAALERTLDAIVQRHEALRTSFQVIEGQPRQVVASHLHLSLAILDLQHVPEAEREAQALRLAEVEAHEPFDLAQPPLLRAKLARIAPDDHVLMLTLHHIIGDAWSFGLLHRELSACYAAFVAGQPAPPLPALPIQYADFAVWQRAHLQSERLQAQLAYWRKQLEAAPLMLELPTDYPRPAASNHKGRKLSLTLPNPLVQALQAFSQEANATLFMTLLAAFKIVLYRYSRQQDIIVGAPMINRNRAEMEPLIGYFLNLLALRTDLSGALTFRELLARVRQVTLEAYANLDFPFERLVQELRPERDLSYSPIFQIFFNMFTPAESGDLDLTGLTVELISRAEIEFGSKFDLTLSIRRHEGKLQFHLTYRTDLFRQERMAELLAQYQQLLAQIVENPDQSIAVYSLITQHARKILPDPALPLPEPPQPLVMRLVAAWAEQTPQQVAISQGGQTWSYAELDERAEAIARTLRAKGMAQRDIVAIYAPRSFGLIAGMLGVLMNGGVFVLIDPALPDERKLVMLQEAKAKWLIHGMAAQTEGGWPQQTNLPVLSLEAATGRVAPAAVETDFVPISPPEIHPDDPAYIFFTSGTTGKPKGILGCHKGLSHFVRWQGERFGIGPADRVAQLIGLSFDPILRDIFLPLTHGATLCLPDAAAYLDPDKLLRWFKQERVTVLHTVPTLAQSWLAHVSTDHFLTDLRWSFFSGEPLTDTLVRQWRVIFPKSEIVNLYGPTETTMVKFYYQLPAEPQKGVQPAGLPMPQTQALVLTPDNRLCGLNEPGEIVIRTPFRTLGYINTPEENQKRFIRNPFRNEAQDKLYFTGDLGCYRPDGLLAILGRLDDQVKVHGVRIELGEINAILAQYPAIQACAVIARKDRQEQNYLAAYIVPKETSSLNLSDLRAYLNQKLMPAMAPTAFVILDRLPLLPTGKVDRQKLPEPDLARPEREDNFVAPRTRTEELLAEIWAELLGLERIGIYNNFFELGGHSLLAAQLISRIQHVLKVELPIRRLFETLTIAGLAGVIEQLKDNQAETAPAKITARPRQAYRWKR